MIKIIKAAIKDLLCINTCDRYFIHIVLKLTKVLQKVDKEIYCPGSSSTFQIPSGIAPVEECCFTKGQVFWEWPTSHFRWKAKDKDLGILVLPGLTLTDHSFQLQNYRWGQLRMSGWQHFFTLYAQFCFFPVPFHGCWFQKTPEHQTHSVFSLENPNCKRQYYYSLRSSFWKVR